STTIANGAHTLNAVARDAAGNVAMAAPVTLIVSNSVSLPVITVAASSPNASRVGPTNGTFTIIRTGATTNALTLNYTLSGTATNGSDYNSLGATVTIPAGAASAAITVTPKASTNLVGAQTVLLTLSANGAYTVGSPNNATVTIAGNGV